LVKAGRKRPAFLSLGSSQKQLAANFSNEGESIEQFALFALIRG